MLRRIFDGLVLGVLVWFAITRLDAGGIALGLGLGAVIAFTAWRIARLWSKYRRLVHELAAAEAARLSADPAERERAERVLRERHAGRTAADITLWSGFVLGAATLDAERGLMHGGGADMTGNYDGIGSDLAGGSFGGADGFGGGGFGGDGGM